MDGNSVIPMQNLTPPPNQNRVMGQSFSVPQNTMQIPPSQAPLQSNSNEIIAPIPIVIPQNTQYAPQTQAWIPQSTLTPVIPQQPQFQQNTPQNPPQITAVPQIPQPEVQPIHHNNVIQTPPQISNNITHTSPISLPSSPQNIDEEIPEDLSLEEKKKITQEIIDKYTDGLSVKDLDEEGLNNLIDMFLLPEEERNEKRAEIEKERDKIQIEMEEIMKDADELKWILDEAVNYVATNKRQLRGLDNDIAELKELNEFDIDSQLANV